MLPDMGYSCRSTSSSSTAIGRAGMLVAAGGISEPDVEGPASTGSPKGLLFSCTLNSVYNVQCDLT